MKKKMFLLMGVFLLLIFCSENNSDKSDNLKDIFVQDVDNDINIQEDVLPSDEDVLVEADDVVFSDEISITDSADSVEDIIDVKDITEFSDDLSDDIRDISDNGFVTDDAVNDVITDTGSDIKKTRIFATFVSHNEENIQVVCTNDFSKQAGYLENRRLTHTLARAIVEKNAAWNLQTDWLYLDSVKKWDTGSVLNDTDGKNIIKYLSELSPKNIVIDAHAHESKYNYADVVFLLQGLGVKDSKLVGGFIYYPYDKEVWTRFENPVSGVNFPQFSWTADILWGAATSLHQGPDSRVAGLWRPKDAEHFHEHSPERRLINVGGYTGDEQGIADLLDKLEKGELEEGKMYTVGIFFNQCTLTDEVNNSIIAIIDKYKQDVEKGNLVWATLQDIVRIWKEEYSSEPVIFEAKTEIPDAGTDAGYDSGTTNCLEGYVCPQNKVCCPKGLPCAGQCIDDCRADTGFKCPPQAPKCDPITGLCGA